MGVVAEHSTVIDGITYTTVTFPATEGLDLMQRFAALVGPDVAALVLGVDDDEAQAVLGVPEVAVAIVTKAAERGAPGDFSSMAKALLVHTTADKVAIGSAEVAGGVAKHFDGHFAGRYLHLLEVCIWVARVSFARP